MKDIDIGTVPVYFRLHSHPHATHITGADTVEEAEALAATIRSNPDAYDVEIDIGE